MRTLSALISAALVSLLSPVWADVTPVSDDDMMEMFNNDTVALAMKSAPMFLFGQALNHPPCIPTFAIVNNTQARPAKLCDWPKAGCDCRNPGRPIGNPAPSFPVYYSVASCILDTVRIQYSLFYEKDGFLPEIANGHRFDWERVIVIWKQSEVDGLWRQSEILLSQHTGYHAIAWKDIHHTFNDDTAHEKLGGPMNQKNLNHPKIYIAWSKHDAHDQRESKFNDILAQSTNNAYRSEDWWYLPKKEDYIQADGSTEIGQLIGSMDWGAASSNPVKIHNELC